MLVLCCVVASCGAQSITDGLDALARRGQRAVRHARRWGLGRRNAEVKAWVARLEQKLRDQQAMWAAAVHAFGEMCSTYERMLGAAACTVLGSPGAMIQSRTPLAADVESECRLVVAAVNCGKSCRVRSVAVGRGAGAPTAAPC